MYNGNVIEGHCVEHRIRDAAVGLSELAESQRGAWNRGNQLGRGEATGRSCQNEANIVDMIYLFQIYTGTSIINMIRE